MDAISIHRSPQGPTVEIIRVQAPSLLMAPGPISLLAAVSRAFDLPPVHETMDEWQAAAEDPSVGLFMGIENGTPLAMAVVGLPRGKLDKLPQVAYFYNRGSQSLRRSLAATVVDFIEKAGYNQFRALNQTGHRDEAWMRLMQPKGWSVSRAGSLMEFSHG